MRRSIASICRICSRIIFEKVKDRTTLRVDYSDYEKDASLKGEFIRMVLGSELSQEQKAEVIRCGILALSGEEI